MRKFKETMIYIILILIFDFIFASIIDICNMSKGKPYGEMTFSPSFWGGAVIGLLIVLVFRFCWENLWSKK